MLEPSFISEPITSLDSNFSSSPNRFQGNQPGRGVSPFTTATINGFIAPLNEPPWHLAQAIPTRTMNYSGNLLPRQLAMSPEVLPPTFPQTHKPRKLQPSKRSSTTSSTLEWSNNTQGTQSIQPLAAPRGQVKLLPRSGVRKGALAPKNAEEARIMRRYKSCWPCKLVKAKVI